MLVNKLHPRLHKRANERAYRISPMVGVFIKNLHSNLFTRIQNALPNGFNTELDGSRYAQSALEKRGRTRALMNDDHVLCVILCFCELQRTEDFTVFNLQM